MSVKGKHLVHSVLLGSDSNVFKPIDKTNQKFLDFKKKILGDKSYDFIVFYNSRNINRKRTSNLILAFRMFCDNLSKEEADKCLLIMHTEKVLDAGTDLGAVGEAFAGMYNTRVIEERFLPDDMNLLYNLCDVTCNISSNEGFGLSCAESMMAGLPVVVNVTGGLQDQIGQTMDDGNPIEFTYNFGSNQDGKYKRCGVWGHPIWPATNYIQGSPQTPYIFDSICKWEDVGEALMYWYLTDKETRITYGLEGRRWAMNEGGINSKNMCDQFIKAMDFTLNNFEPEPEFSIHTDKEHVGHKMPFDSLGFDMPIIDKEKLKEKINFVKLNEHF